MASCSLCKVLFKPWIKWHGDDVVSLKPFGATTDGHRMFLPAKHVTDAAEDPPLTGRCFEEAARWGSLMRKPFNLVVNSGADADQTAFHLHVHYVPRVLGDGLGYRWKAEQA